LLRRNCTNPDIDSATVLGKLARIGLVALPVATVSAVLMFNVAAQVRRAPIN
jgi:hypothetical protein